jgi:hypothetical protein
MGSGAMVKGTRRSCPLLAESDHVLFAYKQFLAVPATTKALTSAFRCCWHEQKHLLEALRYATHLGT